MKIIASVEINISASERNMLVFRFASDVINLSRYSVT